METEIQEVADTKTEINFKTLLTAGAHFGHKTATWNPDMASFIYGSRNKVYIIDINLTISMWEEAREFLTALTSKGGDVMFVGTKKQAQVSLKEQALRAGSPYVDYRWPPGLLTNFATVKKSIDKLKKLKTVIAEHASGARSDYTKKELLSMQKIVDKLELEVGGVTEMRRLPVALFVNDVNKDHIAVEEAKLLNIPVVAVCDTDSTIKDIPFVIPSNDDAVSTLALFNAAVADAVLEGKRAYKERDFLKSKKGSNLISDLDEGLVEPELLEKSGPREVKVSYKKAS